MAGITKRLKPHGGQETAPWRDNPKLVLALEIDGEVVLKTDENWCEYDYDDSDWDNAVKDKNPPKGVFRECL